MCTIILDKITWEIKIDNLVKEGHQRTLNQISTSSLENIIYKALGSKF